MSDVADADRTDLVDTAYEEIQECIAFHQRLAYADAWDIDPDSDQLKGHEGIGEGTSENIHGVLEIVNTLIDRLLAASDAPGLDELLDSVHPESAVTAWLESRPEPESGIMAPHFMAKIETHGKNVFWGDGTTRMDAIRNAVAQATATQEGTSDE